MTLYDDLQQAERETAGERARTCPLCEYIQSLDPGPTQIALMSAAAGTIGIRKLEAIMQKHETGVGRRTITRHRKEGHTP